MIEGDAETTRAFNIQIKWLIENENEKEKAEYLKEQFQIDSKKDGRVYNFWQEKMRAKKLKETKKGASIDADNRILTVRNDTGSNTLNVRNDNATNSSSDQNNRTRKNEKSCEGNLKRKSEDDEPYYEGLTLLFDGSNEDTLVESIDEKILEQENVLLKASGDSVLKSQLKNMDPRIVEAFCAYQETIPKSRKMLTNDDGRRAKNVYNVTIISWDISSDKIKNTWGEIEALPTKYARNEKETHLKEHG
ncbi:27664_t:CDS:2 [Gigaspora margarita]|uniref:27664_t:CDS:1 n=1 Tax=Gigaspora margarita TaxID=4874 RepID=A0ABN7UQZ0_GIGMA|nr:27664_t:CDS:2 [Gigaspora margarita]